MNGRRSIVLLENLDLGKRTDDLFDEILKNVRNDREQVTLVRDNIIKGLSTLEVAIEPLAMLGVAENIAKLSDVLTKMNSQLVELTKVSVKTDMPEEDVKSSKDSIFDEIEASGTQVGDGSN